MSDVMVERRLPLSIAAFLLLLLVLAAGAGAMGVASRVTTLNEEAKNFADSAVSGIAEEWSDKQLLERVSPTEREALQPADLQGLSDLRARLGHFQTNLGATGGVDAPYIRLFVGPLQATYDAKVIFVSGIVWFHLRLAKLDGHWTIDGYHLDAQYYGRPGTGLL
jgi:hypothetical protein